VLYHRQHPLGLHRSPRNPMKSESSSGTTSLITAQLLPGVKVVVRAPRFVLGVIGVEAMFAEYGATLSRGY
jgi:hypothetical protein